VSTPPTQSPTALPIATTVGVVFLAIAAAAELLTPTGLTQIQSQLAQNLGMSKANMVLNIISGSVILQ
jgi:hypothetical protein